MKFKNWKRKRKKFKNPLKIAGRDLDLQRESLKRNIKKEAQALHLARLLLKKR
jgi:hypothetical protein